MTDEARHDDSAASDHPSSRKPRRRKNGASLGTANGHAGSARTFNLAADDDIRIHELNDKHAVVCEHGKTLIITERFDTQLGRRILDRSSANDFMLRYRNRLVSTGNSYATLGKFWLEHPLRRQYEEILFDPTPNLEPRPEVYNLWRGWPIKAAPGKWPLFRDHLFNIGACGDDDIFSFTLDWVARLFQFPQHPAGTAIVWRGIPGSGKGFIARAIGKLVGQYFVHVSRVQHLVGNFNGHLQDALLVFSDEAFWAGDKASEGALKTLITEPTLVIERKGRDAVVVPNRVHLLMATNNDWAAPVGLADRRFLVVDVPDIKANDRAYFTKISDELEAGGLAGFMWDMLHRDVPAPPVMPRSATAVGASLVQKTFSMTPVQQWWFSKLESGQIHRALPGFGAEIAREELHDDYIRSMQKLNVVRRAAEIELGISLRKMCPEIGTVQRRDGAVRTRYWKLPPLDECRLSFQKILGLPDWFAWEGHQDDDDPAQTS